MQKQQNSEVIQHIKDNPSQYEASYISKVNSRQDNIIEYTQSLEIKSIQRFIDSKKTNINQKNTTAQIHNLYSVLNQHLKEFQGYKKFNSYIGENIEKIINNKTLSNQALGHLGTLRNKMYQFCKHNQGSKQIKQKLYQWIRLQFKSQNQNTSKFTNKQKQASFNKKNTQLLIQNKQTKDNLFEDGPTFVWMINQFLKNQSKQPSQIKPARKNQISKIVQKFKNKKHNEEVQARKLFKNYIDDSNISSTVSNVKILSPQESYRKLIRQLNQNDDQMQQIFKIFHKENYQNPNFTFYQFMGYNLSMFIHFLIRVMYATFQSLFQQLDLRQTLFYEAHRRVFVQLVRQSEKTKNNKENSNKKSGNKSSQNNQTPTSPQPLNQILLKKRIHSYQDQLPIIMLQCIMRNKHFKKYKQNLQAQFMISYIKQQKRKNNSLQNCHPIQYYISIQQQLQDYKIHQITDLFMQMVLQPDFRTISLKRIIQKKIEFFWFINSQTKRVNDKNRKGQTIGTDDKNRLTDKFLQLNTFMKNKFKIFIVDRINWTDDYFKHNQSDNQPFYIEISLFQKVLIEWQMLYFFIHSIQFVRNNIQTALIIDMDQWNKDKDNKKKYTVTTFNPGQVIQVYQILNRDLKNYHFPGYFQLNRFQAQQKNRRNIKNGLQEQKFQFTAQFFYPRSPKPKQFPEYTYLNEYKTVYKSKSSNKLNNNNPQYLNKSKQISNNKFQQNNLKISKMNKNYNAQQKQNSKSIYQKLLQKNYSQIQNYYKQLKSQKYSLIKSYDKEENYYLHLNWFHIHIVNSDLKLNEDLIYKQKVEPAKLFKSKIKGFTQICQQQQFIKHRENLKIKRSKKSQAQSILFEPPPQEPLQPIQIQINSKSMPVTISRDFQMFIKKVYLISIGQQIVHLQQK